MPNELEEKIQNITHKQKIVRELLLSEFDGAPETLMEINAGEEREEMAARLKDPKKVALELNQIYSGFAELGFNVKREIIKNPNNKTALPSYFFAIERPVEHEGNMDPLTAEDDQIKLALVALTVKLPRPKQEFSDKIIFAEIVGSLATQDLNELLKKRSAAFLETIKKAANEPKPKIIAEMDWDKLLPPEDWLAAEDEEEKEEKMMKEEELKTKTTTAESPTP